LYDGYHDGLFGFYVRALDPNYDRRVMLGQHLLYHYGPRSTFDWVETLRASTTQEVVDLLRKKSGCRWVAIEVGPNSEWAAGQRLLRQAVARPEFSLVRSFPVVATGAKRIDLYRLAGPVLAVETVDLELASYRTRRFECVVPIRR
jgi:hypothetical protein